MEEVPELHWVHAVVKHVNSGSSIIRQFGKGQQQRKLLRLASIAYKAAGREGRVASERAAGKEVVMVRERSDWLRAIGKERN
jgi:hypothetical protein